MYNDEFDTKTRPSSGSLTKLTVIYLTVANLGYDMQAKRHNILLSTICNKENLKIINKNKLQQDQFFKPLIDDINELNQNIIYLGITSVR